jgi:hypothetical protein
VSAGGGGGSSLWLHVQPIIINGRAKIPTIAIRKVVRIKFSYRKKIYAAALRIAT